MAEKIHVAVIQNKYGHNVYAARSLNGITTQIAEYCRENWETEGLDGNPPDSDDEIIEEYFDAVAGREWLCDEATELLD